MELLRSYLASLDPDSRAAFCARCGTTLGYVEKVIWLRGRKRFGDGLTVVFERESDGVVTCESLRPDINWSRFRAAAVSARPLCKLLRPDIDWGYLGASAAKSRASRSRRSASAAS